jgi:hypothetical protein
MEFTAGNSRPLPSPPSVSLMKHLASSPIDALHVARSCARIFNHTLHCRRRSDHRGMEPLPRLRASMGEKELPCVILWAWGFDLHPGNSNLLLYVFKFEKSRFHLSAPKKIILEGEETNLWNTYCTRGRGLDRATASTLLRNSARHL